MKILSVGGIFPIPFLREAGHQVMALSPRFSTSHPDNIPLDFFLNPETLRATIRDAVFRFQPDWILQVDDSTPLIHLGLEELEIPKAWYAVDTHLHGPWQRHLAPVFDLVLCAQKNRMEILSQYHRQVKWLPLFYTDTPDFLPWLSRDHDVSFVGTLDPVLHPRRIALLEGVRNLGVNLNIQQGGVQPVYLNSRIVINQSAADDLNFRFFEAMGNGALLITDRISHSLEDMGEPGRDFLVYEPDDARDLVEKINWALTNPQDSEAIARRGHALVSGNHLGQHRAHSLLTYFSESQSLPVRISNGVEVLAHLAWTHDYASRLTLPDALVQFFTLGALRLASAVERVSPDNPWVALIRTRQAVDKGSMSDALGYLSRLTGPPEDAVLRKPFLFFQALLLAHSGKFAQARQTVLMGLKDFPEDPDLGQLRDYLARGEAAA